MRLYYVCLTMAALLYSTEMSRCGTPADSSIKETLISTGLSGATSMAWAPDGSNRLFVTRKGGEIRIIKSGTLLSTPFATLSPIYTSSECGLLGICFDPNFVSNKYVYVFVTVSSSEQQIIRYTASGDVGGSKTILIRGLPTRGANHDGGQISIGPDGKLYWAIGDLGNNSGVDSDLSSLASKVGRANLDGTPVNDNPYYSTSDGIGPRDYIWARGFRNPFSHSWHKGTGKMWVNVVGHNYEQVFAISRGNHGGWDNYEGGNQPSGYVKPVIQYVTNGGVGGCITGGTFYNGTAFPSQYRGNYFYGDYNSKKILRAVVGSTGSVSSANITFVSSVGSVIDISEGPDGALYYVNYAGEVRRLAYANTTQEIIVSTTSVGVGEGSGATFSVRLATAPSSTVYVNSARTSGDSDVTVSGGSSLSFTSSNYSTPQTVTVAAAHDSDTNDDSAVISVSASGLSTKSVSVSVNDDDTQSFVLSSSSLSLIESGSGSLTVRLSNKPSSTVSVTVARTSGDSDVNVTAGATLSFTSSNYSTPQTVTIGARSDSDTSNDSAVISVAASGISTRTVSVSVADDDASAPLITSSPVTAGILGVLYKYDVNATGLPAPTYSLASAPSGMTISSSTGLISWTPTVTGSFSVKVVAANGISPSASQSFTITVASDKAPTAKITRPLSGETVSGKTAEWYGDGIDDGGTVKAEFYVDGVLKYTDSNTSGHYHYGGTHNVWDTTGLSNGSHVLKMVVYDAKGQSGSQSVTVTVSNTSSSGLSAPANLSATAGDTRITLNWSSVSGATGYRVKRTKTDGGTFSTIATVTGTTYQDSGLVNGRTYYYVVSAINSTSESPNSNSVSVVPTSGTTSTTAPAAPSGLSASAASSSSISLAWSDNSSNESGFKIERKTGSSGTYSQIASVGAGVRSYSNSGLSSGTQYYYRVRATNSAGDSGYSNEASATTHSSSTSNVPAPPATVTAKAGSTTVAISWTASSGAAGYRVKRTKYPENAPSTIATVTSTSFTDSGLVTGRTYYYAISAYNSNGESANSGLVKTVPGSGATTTSSTTTSDSTSGESDSDSSTGSVPSGLTGTAGQTEAVLSWNAFSGATAYKVKRTKTDGGPYSTIEQVSGTGHTDNGLVTGRTYYYVVSAVTSSGETADSAQVAVTPGSGATTTASSTTTISETSNSSGAPEDLEAAAGDSEVALAWVGVTGASSYYIKRSKTDGGPYGTIEVVNSTEHVDDGLVNGRTYYYVVSAVTSSGETADSAQVAATPGSGATATTSSTTTSSETSTSSGAPEDLEAAVGDSEIALAWVGVTGASGYHIKRSKTDGGPYGTIAFVNSTEHVDDGLVNGRSYYYVVSAELSTGETANSNQAGGTPQSSISIASAVPSSPVVDELPVVPVLTIERRSNGRVEITLSGQEPGSYAIERSSNLRDWEPLKSVDLADGTVTVSDAADETVSQRFYRVVRVP